jgi:hypothetical protein
MPTIYVIVLSLMLYHLSFLILIHILTLILAFINILI